MLLEEIEISKGRINPPRHNHHHEDYENEQPIYEDQEDEIRQSYETSNEVCKNLKVKHLG